MKKRLVSFLLLLVLALGLCAGVSAAPVWTVADGALSVGGLVGGQYAFAAWYDKAGQYLSTQVLTADGALHPDPAAASVKLICTDDRLAPLDVAFTLPRGNDYRVRKTGDQVELYCQGPNGVAVSWPMTRKVSGRLVYYSDREGKLCVGGEYYSPTQLPVDGCAYTVTPAGFQNWSDQPGAPGMDSLDFYLDPWGNICWIDLVREYHYPTDTCLLLCAECTADGIVRAELMDFLGTVFQVNVSRLSSETITDPAAAVDKLRANAPGGFYACSQERDGTYSMSFMESSLSNGWQRAVPIPAGTVLAPAEDFTGGAVDCIANDATLFMVVSGPSGSETVTRYTGWQNLPAGLTAAEGSNVYTVYYENSPGYPAPKARLVYLRAAEG